MPLHYWRACLDYYEFVRSPREDDDDDEGIDGRVIDFDKMSDAKKKSLSSWAADSVKGEEV